MLAVIELHLCTDRIDYVPFIQESCIVKKQASRQSTDETMTAGLAGFTTEQQGEAKGDIVDSDDFWMNQDKWDVINSVRTERVRSSSGSKLVGSLNFFPDAPFICGQKNTGQLIERWASLYIIAIMVGCHGKETRAMRVTGGRAE